MAAVLFRSPGDHPTLREANEADGIERSLRDELSKEFESHPGLVTVILRQGQGQHWELHSIDPDEEAARLLAASVIARSTHRKRS